MNSLKVKNLTGISKMADFFFLCNFLDGMYTSVHESKCFELNFAEVNDGFLSVTEINNLNLVFSEKKKSLRINIHPIPLHPSP